MFKTILVPIDQGPEAFDKSFEAIEVVKNHCSRLVVRSVLDPEITEMINQNVMKSVLAAVREKIEQAVLDCEVIERKGKPAFVIGDVAYKSTVDLIVMGIKGLLNLKGNLETTTVRVLELVSGPVMVVP